MYVKKFAGLGEVTDFICHKIIRTFEMLDFWQLYYHKESCT